MEDTITTKILTIGEENANGLIYSKEMAQSIIKSFQDRGYILGIQGSLEDEEGLPVTEVTHKIVEISLIEGKHLVAEIKILDTPNGDDFRKFYEENKDDIVFKPEGTGEIDGSTKLIYQYDVKGINALLKSETEQKNKEGNNED